MKKRNSEKQPISSRISRLTAWLLLIMKIPNSVVVSDLMERSHVITEMVWRFT